MISPKIVRANELRKYMGSGHSIIPRGSTVRLISKFFWGSWRVGVVEYRGMKYIIPIRALWKIDSERRYEDDNPEECEGE